MLLILTITLVVVNNTTVPPGDNYNTGYTQALNTDKIDGAAGITNVDHCPRDAMSQQYRTGWNAGYTGIKGGEVNNAKNNIAMVIIKLEYQ